MITRFRFCLTLICVTALFACGKASECLVADSVLELKPVITRNFSYYLFVKTTGLSDKSVFYQMYGERPTFDKCGKPLRTPVSEIYVDSMEGVPAKLIISGKRLDLEYSRGDATVKDLADIVVEIR